MKLKSKDGKFILIDGSKRIVFDNVFCAMGYVFMMFNFKKIPYVSPPMRPVRSLTPHPKKIVLKNEDKIKISIIKSNIPIFTI